MVMARVVTNKRLDVVQLEWRKFLYVLDHIQRLIRAARNNFENNFIIDERC